MLPLQLKWIHWVSILWARLGSGAHIQVTKSCSWLPRPNPLPVHSQHMDSVHSYLSHQPSKLKTPNLNVHPIHLVRLRCCVHSPSETCGTPLRHCHLAQGFVKYALEIPMQTKNTWPQHAAACLLPPGARSHVTYQEKTTCGADPLATFCLCVEHY